MWPRYKRRIDDGRGWCCPTIHWWGKSSTFCARRDTLSPRQFLSSPFEFRYLALRCVAFSLGRFHPRSNRQDPFWKFSWWFYLWSHRLSSLSPSNSFCLIKIFLKIFDVKFRSDIIKSQWATPTRSLEAAILTLTFSMLNYHSPRRHVMSRVSIVKNCETDHARRDSWLFVFYEGELCTVSFCFSRLRRYDLLGSSLERRWRFYFMGHFGRTCPLWERFARDFSASSKFI